jgi:peptidyl-prolyl cis-trans isomerase D
MQIIQSIRDKGAAITVVVIALSLIGFILMDRSSGNNNAGRAGGTSVGKVNGQGIELAEFQKRVTQLEAQEESRTRQKVTTQQTYQIREQVWNQLVAEAVFYKEAAKLGIELTPKELSAILFSSDPTNPFMQQGLADQATGKLDMAKAQQAWAEIKKSRGEARDNINSQLIDPLKLSSSAAKYGGLISASAYYPTWMQERDNKDALAFSTISYVGIPYTEISDSAVKVTDQDITDYVNKNKELFKQEAGRKISYLSFSQLPTAADSAAIRSSLETIKSSFATDSNAKAFVAASGSAIEFNDAFLPKDKIGASNIDTIVKQPQGSVFGPVVEQGLYILSKVLATKEMPDSVRAREIVIGLNDPQTNQPIRDQAGAQKLADSLLGVIKNGGDFVSMAVQYSADNESKAKGGDMGVFAFGTKDPAINEFAFNKPVGSKEVILSNDGYHIIEIISQSNFKPAYKIAFIAKEIAASPETITKASNDAGKAASEKNATTLAAYVSKNGLHLTQLPQLIKENDFNAGTLQDSRTRELIKWAFKANKGDVSEPFDLGDQFVVATVDKIEKEGVQDAATARSGAEVIIIKQKKAALIKTALGTNPTMQSASAKYNKQIAVAGQDSTLTFNSQIINSLGMESKVIGAAFNKTYETKESPVIDGTNGVYIIKVNSIQNKAAEAPEVTAARIASRLNSLRSQSNNWFEGLRKQADIKDKRSENF